MSPVVALGLTFCLAAGGALADEKMLAAGRAIAIDRNGGNCSSCHWIEGVEMPGNSGPPLLQMRQRFPERSALRAQIEDPRVRNPDTVMPPYGAHGILSRRELDLLVEFLYSL